MSFRKLSKSCEFPGHHRLQEVKGLRFPVLDVGHLGELPPDNGEEALQVAEPVRGRQQVLHHLGQVQHLQNREWGLEFRIGKNAKYRM